jgi:hypothetical protein
MAIAWGMLLWTKALEHVDRASRKRMKKRLLQAMSSVREQLSWSSKQ